MDNYIERMMNLSVDGVKYAKKATNELDILANQTAARMSNMTDDQKKDYEKKMKEIKALKKQLKDAGTINQ